MRCLYRTSRGSWQPARLVQADIILGCYAAIIQACLRSWDYATGNEGDLNAPNLSLVEEAFPLWFWSICFAIGSGILLFGVKQKRHFLVWLGHKWLFGCYFTLCLGILISVIGHPWFDGVRYASVLLLPGSFHWLLARRTGPKPSRRYHVVEKVGGPA